MRNLTIKIEIESQQSGIQFFIDDYPVSWESLSKKEQMYVVTSLRDHYKLFFNHLKLK
jgi:hypothetical protein